MPKRSRVSGWVRGWARSVDPAGAVRKVYTKVDPNGHEQAVLKDIAALKT